MSYIMNISDNDMVTAPALMVDVGPDPGFAIFRSAARLHLVISKTYSFPYISC